MNQATRQQPNQSAAQRQPRTGLIPARIGTNHIVKCGDGITRSLTVKDLSQRKPAKDSEVPVVGCLTCGKLAPDFAALQSDHPSAAEMKKAGEAHVYAFVALKGWKDTPTGEVDLDLEPKQALAAFNAISTKNRNALAAYERSALGLFSEPVLE
jgi:hypothetical protein